MKDNPFAAFAATSAPKTRGGSNSKGWMKTRKVGKDDTAIKIAKSTAEERRKAKNRRGVAKGGTSWKGAKRDAKKRKGRPRGGFIDDSDDESFNAYSEEEEDDSFIAESGDENDGLFSDEEEGDWDSGMEDEDDDFGESSKKKKKKKQQPPKSKAKAKKSTPLSRTARDSRRTNQNSTWKPPSSQNSTEDDDIEESPVPPPRGGGRRKKKIEPSPISLLDSDDEMSDIVDGGIDRKEKRKDLSSDPMMWPSPVREKRKRTKSKYFSSAEKEFGEEKKEEEDENVMYGRSNANKKRRILDDSEDSDDENWGSENISKSSNKGVAVDLFDDDDDDDDDDDLDDTPGNLPSKSNNKKNAFKHHDYAQDDDEVRAIQEAMQLSLEEESKGYNKRKRLKKKKTKGGRNHTSSLEQIDKTSSPMNEPKYKDDVEPLRDSDPDDNANEDDEVEVYEAVDEEEQTAAQVLNEANTLSAKIVRVVNGWCSTLDGGNKVSGLILGDGASNLGGSGGAVAGGGVNGGGKGEEKDAVEKGGDDKGNDATKLKDDMWISNEAMREIMPNAKLAEYQLLGVNWMALLNRSMFGKGGSQKKGRNGGMNVNGILADEMGLGKTVQTIAFLAWLNQQSKKSNNNEDGGDGTPQRQRPHLIVVPASVLSNWMNEFKKFAPDMTVVKYHGNMNEREEIRCELDRFLHRRGNDVEEPLDAVLTTFSYFSSDSNKGDRSFLRKFEFDYLVVDEGHTLKNPKGLRYKNLNKFQTSHRLLLTGTPVQNSPKELMSLLCFLMPLFDRKTKSSKRKRGYDADEDDDNDGGERMLEYFVHLEGGSLHGSAAAYRKLKQLFAPFVLRRKKEDVLGQLLPPKTRTVEIVPMDEATRIAYESILSSHIEARKNARAKPTAKNYAAAQKHLFTTLRKAANHPLLLRNRYVTEEDKDNLARLALDYHWFGNDASCTLQLVKDELDKFSDYEIHCAALAMIDESAARRKYLERYTLMENDLFCSPKFVRLRTLIPSLISDGHRILIFSQWTKVLDLMGHLMDHLDLGYLRLDGSTAVSERQDLIDTFNNDASLSVFLLSTRAGGMGLNLTSADTCILHDLDFNPFNDRQAEDRCHRIGQKKHVKIIKMVCGGTVDEDIYSIQERKAKMNEAIMEEESGGKKRIKKSSDNDEMCRLASAAVERFEARKATCATTSSAVTDSSEGVKGAVPETIPDASSGEKKTNDSAATRKTTKPGANWSDSSDGSDDEMSKRLREKLARSKEVISID